MGPHADTFSRRQVLGMGLGLAAGTIISPRGSDAAGFDWMQQKGKSLVVLAPLSPYYTVLQKMVPDFTKMTGIQVEYQVVPEQQLRQKMPIELNAKSPGVDAFSSSMHVEKLLFSQVGWYEPLNKYLDNPNLTAPDYNWKDFGPAGTYWGLKGDGTVVAIPMGVGLGAYMYRKDLYAEKGLKPTTTVDELIAAVKALHKPPAVFGYAGRGLKNANIPVWGCLTIALGGDYLDKTKTQLLTTTPEAIEAARIYADLVRTYAPPGIHRLQLDGVPGRVHPGPRGVLAGQHPVRRSVRGPDQVQGRGQGRLRAAPGQRQDEALRRHGDGRLRAEPVRQEQGSGLALHPVGEQPSRPVSA